VGRQHTAFGDRAADRLPIVAAIDGDVVAAEREDQQSEEGIILDRRVGQRLMQRLGAQIADHRDTLLRHVRPGPRGRCIVIVAGAISRTGRGVAAIRRFAGLLGLG